MTRRMSCALTVDAVRARIKDVTRRHPDTWKTLKPGDRLTLVEKAQGLRKGERQVVLAEVEIVDVSVEPLFLVTAAECRREGLPDLSTSEFQRFWLDGHGYAGLSVEHSGTLCRRIEWRYLT